MADWALGMMLPDIPRACTAAAEWLACMFTVLQVSRRFGGWRLAAVSAAFLVWQTVFMVVTDGLTGGWWVLCIAAALLFMFLFQELCCEGSVWDNGFRCIESFILAEFAASFGWQMYCYVYYAMEITVPAADMGALVLGFALVYGVMWFLTKNFLKMKEALEVKPWEMVLALIIGALIFLMSNLSFASANTPFSAVFSSAIFNIRTLIDLGGAAILYAYHVLRVNIRADCDLALMESMLEHQYRQYQQSRETLDMINYKYHDLKHQILVLKAETDDERRLECLNEMEQSVSGYETENRTGNKALDIILTNKSLECRNSGISLTSVVNGELLNFLETTEICSIFGNALDNAIECERKIAEPEKRVIHLAVYAQKNFLIVRCENTCEEQVDMRQGLPQTTKGERGLHGYGLKSIRSIARKYGGEMKVSAEDGRFTLKILIPMTGREENTEGT